MASITVRLIRVFVSSPGDVAEERNALDEVVARINRTEGDNRGVRLEAVTWEHDVAPQIGPLPQDVIDGQLPAFDIFLGIMAHRFGGDTTRESGTEKECRAAVERWGKQGRPWILFYFSDTPPTSKKPAEIQQYLKVCEFRESLEGRGIVGSYEAVHGPRGFTSEVEQHLRLVLKQLPKTLQKPIRRGKPPKVVRPRPTTEAEIPANYLAWLRRECGSVELLGLKLRQGQSVRIGNVYVPLSTSLQSESLDLERKKVKRKSRKVLADTEGEPTLLMPLLERHSLYVSGAPGSGKSTFCRWVAWLLASGAMPDRGFNEANTGVDSEETFPHALRGKLPVLVRLRDFQHLLPDARDFGAYRFERALEQWLADRMPGGLNWPVVRDQLERGNAMLIFDGVDEVPPSRRDAAIDGLAESVLAWEEKGNRVLVTSRPYGLTAADIGRLGLPHAPLEGLSYEFQKLLVKRWFVILSDDLEAGEKTANGLLADLRHRLWLQPLAANPLLLTAMSIVYGQGHRLPQDKHELYDRIVDTVLHSRFDARVVPLVRNRLAVVAHGMHTGEGLDDTREAPEAQTTEKEIDLMLQAYQQADPYFTEEGFKQVTESRERLLSDSGLLLPLDGRRAAFYHLSLQEFLAAERMADLERERLLTVLTTRGMRGEWRNTLSFLFGAQLANNAAPRRAAELLVSLIERINVSTPSALAVLAADCVEILQGRGVRLRDESIGSLRNVCIAGMRSELAARDRCTLGESLAKIGDVRFRSDAWFLPDDPLLGFVEIPAGEFWMIADRYQEGRSDLRSLDRFLISRWPVTVAQFRAFATDDKDNFGFNPENPDCLRGSDNQPVVNVSYLEAQWYCSWLTRKLRSSTVTHPMIDELLVKDTPAAAWRVTVPSNAEWVRAARGSDPRPFPWGDREDPNRANVRDTGIGEPSSVGCFQGGASPFGIEELFGNVWEWTRTTREALVRTSDGLHERVDEYSLDVLDRLSSVIYSRDDWMVVGGCFSDSMEHNRGMRSIVGPGGSHRVVGFRLAISCFHAERAVLT